MYGRRLFLVIMALIGAFILFLVLAFYLYPIINPEAAYGTYETYINDDLRNFTQQDYDNAKAELERLKAQLAGMQGKEVQDQAVIDSLYQLSQDQEMQIVALEGRINGLTRQQASIQRTQDSVAVVARSLLNLDEDELGPIVNRLSDKLLVDLYQSSRTIQREKLLRSLEPGKAATLLRRVMS